MTPTEEQARQPKAHAAGAVLSEAVPPGSASAEAGACPVQAVAGHPALGSAREASARASLAGLVLRPEILARLEAVVQENSRADVLFSRGLAPCRRLLMAGPDGCGRRLAARYIASRLGLPVASFDLALLLGLPRAKARRSIENLFAKADQARSCFLLPGFGSLLAASRAQPPLGLAEALLHELAGDASASLFFVLAGADVLGEADVTRAFDDALAFALPDPAAAVELVRRSLGDFAGTLPSRPALLEACRGLSHRSIALACQDELKACVLAGQTTVDPASLLRSLRRRAFAE